MEQEIQNLINTAHKVIRGFVRNPEEAMDLTQQVLLKVLEKRATFEGKSSLNTWVYRLAANLAIDSFRKPVLKLFKLDWYEQVDDDEDIRLDVREALIRLDDDKREIMTLYFFAGLKISEISEKLGIPMGTANARFERAKEALRAILKEMGYEYE
ncbi:MAG: RNA polymerase sigma factor [Fibrobacteres bacterium]|nr:RNA polymerase sigma factor [Fibrobacterota bacterium]